MDRALRISSFLSAELYLILGYVEGGELFDYICQNGWLSTSEALSYFQQIIAAGPNR